MPIIPSLYHPPLLFKNGHFSTIYSGLFRKVSGVKQQRERIVLTDGDFLDLDWSYSKSQTNKVAIIVHGLEGNAQRAYVLGSAKLFNLSNYDCCSINLRGCSGETNTLFRSYHSGATEDLNAVISHILENKNYDELYLKGFSLGGNLVLKYLGERPTKVPSQIKSAVAISVPCNLKNSQEQFLKTNNILYAKRFKKHLKEKLVEKLEIFPDLISTKEIQNIKTLKDFDDTYTSKAHGFKNALDYYKNCSSLQFLPNIKIPTLLINAKNDSFLGVDCYPYLEAKNSLSLYFEIPNFGGHVGFFGKENITYSEKRGLNFFNEVY
ncbi:hypothetical protein CLV91_1071 [Maribacter vaceletii]|uniref:AB hydrolase-1 domain-containing protein n=1 Tax=Maribacter vaceletii TaxID=1206816 RepID=A0A495EEA2_9FLAO|nr:alpha/beta fold hydrolase [Maribacter vaceletii]RKR14989.1 hypothetical protein CLV91_1071 [Maribacter vaceletii]